MQGLIFINGFTGPQVIFKVQDELIGKLFEIDITDLELSDKIFLNVSFGGMVIL
jgi:hypothetical protein